MTECLREVAEVLASGRIDLLGVQTDVIGAMEEALESVVGFVEAADASQRLDEPEGADDESSFRPNETVRPVVAIDEVVDSEFASYAIHGADHPGMRRREEGVLEGEPEEGRVRSAAGYGDERVPGRIDSVRDEPALDLGSGAAVAVEREVHAVLHRETLEMTPADECHDLGVDVMDTAGTDFPDAVVRFVPPVNDDIGKATKETVVVAVERATERTITREGIDDFTVDIELELLRGLVPDTDGTTAPVAVEVDEQVLRDMRLTVEGIDDLQFRLSKTRSVEDPIDECVGFLMEAQTEERANGEGGIAEPTIPVIPVAGATRLLGERGGRCGDHGTRGRIGKELECERAALDCLAIGAGIGAVQDPLRPVVEGQTLEGVEKLRNGEFDGCFVGVGEGEIGGLPGFEYEGAAQDGAPLLERDARVENGSAMIPSVLVPLAGEHAEFWGLPTEAGTKANGHLEGDATGLAADATDEKRLGEREVSFLGLGEGREKIGETYLAGRGGEEGFEDVGTVTIASLGSSGVVGQDAPVSTEISVEDAGKDGVGVETREA